MNKLMVRTIKKNVNTNNFLLNLFATGLKKGQFTEDRDLKCYTFCVAQMAGTMKKNEISEQKTLNQIDNVFPTEMKENSRRMFEACRTVQSNYKDPCDRVFYSTKCMYEFSPNTFVFP